VGFTGFFEVRGRAAFSEIEGEKGAHSTRVLRLVCVLHAVVVNGSRP
jgi:hypothetical protein